MSRSHEPAFQNWMTATPEEFAKKTEQMLAVWKHLYDGEAYQRCVQEIAAEACIDEIVELLRGVEPTKPLFRDARQTLIELLPKLKSGNVTRDDLLTICKYARRGARTGPTFAPPKTGPATRRPASAIRNCARHFAGASAITSFCRGTMMRPNSPPAWAETAAADQCCR